MPTDPTHIDPAHAELLAKARRATPGPWDGVPLTEQCDRDYLAASHPAAIIDLITQLGEARAAYEKLKVEHEHAMQALMLGEDETRKALFRLQGSCRCRIGTDDQSHVMWINDGCPIHGKGISLPPADFQRTPRQQKKFDKKLQRAARGTAAGEGDKHE
jgi:hypothetical protein